MQRFALLSAVAAALAMAPSAALAAPITIEYYYRIKWGSGTEFRDLYKRNHEPILKEMQKQGFITAIKTESPFTHIAGGQRWDLRVTITFRDEATGVGVGGAYDKAAEAAAIKLYPDQAKFDAEEARRFGLLEEHWDVIVMPE